MVSKPMYIKLPYRNCLRTPGRTESSVFEVRGDELIQLEPVNTYMSKTGAHGEDVYELDTAKKYIVYIEEVSNTGKPSARIHVIDRGKTVFSAYLDWQTPIDEFDNVELELSKYVGPKIARFVVEKAKVHILSDC